MVFALKDATTYSIHEYTVAHLCSQYVRHPPSHFVYMEFTLNDDTISVYECTFSHLWQSISSTPNAAIIEYMVFPRTDATIVYLNTHMLIYAAHKATPTQPSLNTTNW